MPRTLDKLVGDVEAPGRPPDYLDHRAREAEEADPHVEVFLSILARMTPEERVSASRHGGFTRSERWIWAARYPDEVPLVNGEFEWLALASADLD